MGTPFAVTAANAFMHKYYHERETFEQYGRHFTLYKRFIDDVFIIWDGPKNFFVLLTPRINALR